MVQGSAWQWNKIAGKFMQISFLFYHLTWAVEHPLFVITINIKYLPVVTVNSYNACKEDLTSQRLENFTVEV